MKPDEIYEEHDLTTRVEEDYQFTEVKLNKLEKLKGAFLWFVTSSVNRNKLALTVKAGIPFLALWGISDTDTLNQLFGSIGDLVVSVGQVVTGTMALWGIIRKIWLAYEIA